MGKKNGRDIVISTASGNVKCKLVRTAIKSIVVFPVENVTVFGEEKINPYQLGVNNTQSSNVYPKITAVGEQDVFRYIGSADSIYTKGGKVHIFYDYMEHELIVLPDITVGENMGGVDIGEIEYVSVRNGSGGDCLGTGDKSEPIPEVSRQSVISTFMLNLGGMEECAVNTWVDVSISGDEVKKKDKSPLQFVRLGTGREVFGGNVRVNGTLIVSSGTEMVKAIGFEDKVPDNVYIKLDF